MAVAEANRVTELERELAGMHERRKGHEAKITELEHRLGRLQSEKSELLQRGAHGGDVSAQLAAGRAEIIALQAEIDDVQQMRIALIGLLNETARDLAEEQRKVTERELAELDAKCKTELLQLREDGLAIAARIKEIGATLSRAHSEATPGVPYWGADAIVVGANRIGAELRAAIRTPEEIRLAVRT
jgi:predicted  nucleic acid-binding Zn-ribbon protein